MLRRNFAKFLSSVLFFTPTYKKEDTELVINAILDKYYIQSITVQSESGITCYNAIKKIDFHNGIRWPK